MTSTEYHAQKCNRGFGMTDWRSSRWPGEQVRTCTGCGGIQTRSNPDE